MTPREVKIAMTKRTKRPRRQGGVHVVVVPQSALVADVTAEVERAGLTLGEFIRLGRADELDNDRLRDLWLMAGSALR